MLKAYFLGLLIGTIIGGTFVITDIVIHNKISTITQANYLEPTPAIETVTPIPSPTVIAPVVETATSSSSIESTPSPTPTPTVIPIDTASIHQTLVAQAAKLGMTDKMSLYFNALGSNYTISMDSSKPWIPASTIKSFVILEAFRQKDAGLIDFDKTITISADNVVPNSYVTDEYPKLHAGTQATIRQLVESMIVQSDNVAYNQLLDILDRRNITNYLKALGINHTIVGQKLNQDDDQLLTDSKTPGYAPITTTAEDLAKLFSILYTNMIPDSNEILSIFKRQKYNDMIPRYLPKDIIVAHKTGFWNQYQHDAGIVYYKDLPYTLVILTSMGGPLPAAQISKTVYDELSHQYGQNVGYVPQQPVIAKKPIYSMKSDINSVVLGISDEKVITPPHAEDLNINEDDLNNYKYIAKDIHSSNSGFFSNFLKILRAWSATDYIDELDSQTVLLREAVKNHSLADTKKATNTISNTLNKIVQNKTNFDDKNKISVYQLFQTDLYLLSKTENTDKEIANLVSSFQNLKKEYALSDLIYTDVPLFIGKIKKIDSDTIFFEDINGGTEKITYTSTTPILDFLTKQPQKLTTTSLVAISVFKNNTDYLTKYIAIDVPSDFMHPLRGVVTKIDPNQNSIVILTKDAKHTEIHINQNTRLLTNDSEISLEGIQIGSTIQTYGTYDISSIFKASSLKVTKNATGELEKIQQ